MAYEVILEEADGKTYGPYSERVVIIGTFGDQKDRLHELDPDSTLLFIKPGVSRQHCEIDARGIPLSVKDLQSSNGTFVNRERLGVSEEWQARLEEGDELSIGRNRLIVRVNQI